MKVLNEAKDKCQSEDDADELERQYVKLRYRQLHEQCADQQRKIAKRQARDKISRIAVIERVEPKKETGFLRTATVWILAILGFGLVAGAVAWAAFSLS